MRLLRSSSILPLLCAAILADGRASFASAQSAPPRRIEKRCGSEIVMFSDVSQIPGDNAAAVYIPYFDDLYIILYAKNLGVLVEVPDGEGAKRTTGSVTLRINEKSYPVFYAGPSPFDGFQQVNIVVPLNEFRSPVTAYLRVCDDASGRCQNTNGATLRR